MTTVAHICAQLNNEADGVRRVIEDLSRQEAEAGADVQVIGLAPKGEAEKRYSWGRVIVAEHQSLGPRVYGYSPKLRRAARAAKAQILHAHGLWMYPVLAASRAAKTGDARLVISPHGMLTPVALSFSTRKKKLISSLYQRRLLERASLLHATSDQEAQEFRDLGLCNPIAIVPNGTALPAARDLAQRRNKTVLTLSRLHPVKGLENLIRAWSDIETDFPDWNLLIAGPDEGDHRTELEQLASTLGLRRVQFYGPVFGATKTDLMSQVSLFALPSKSENFAMAVAESLAAGTPVISTKGAPWEGLETWNCGWWINHGVAPLAMALRQAMSSSPSELTAMGLRGRDWMERDFSWGRSAKMMLEAYQWAIEGDAPPSHIHIG